MWRWIYIAHNRNKIRILPSCNLSMLWPHKSIELSFDFPEEHLTLFKERETSVGKQFTSKVMQGPLPLSRIFSSQKTPVLIFSVLPTNKTTLIKQTKRFPSTYKRRCVCGLLFICTHVTLDSERLWQVYFRLLLNGVNYNTSECIKSAHIDCQSYSAYPLKWLKLHATIPTYDLQTTRRWQKAGIATSFVELWLWWYFPWVPWLYHDPLTVNGIGGKEAQRVSLKWFTLRKWTQITVTEVKGPSVILISPTHGLIHFHKMDCFT